MIRILVGGLLLPYSLISFPGGEIQVRLSNKPKNSVIIRADMTNTQEVMELLLVTDALRRSGVRSIELVMPYLPYGRQDRVVVEGESFSLKVFCDLINAQKYSSVEIWDAHSDVSTALLDNVINRHQGEFVRRIKIPPETLLVAPDAGSLKKIYAVNDEIFKTRGYRLGVIRADKKRNPNTGEINGVVVYHECEGREDFLIVDDICDGGKTFVELAHKLREISVGNIDLYVTHGIFSNGFNRLSEVLNNIYCPNVFLNIYDHPILKRI